MRALVLNCTLKTSPTPSNTQVLADVVIDPRQRHPDHGHPDVARAAIERRQARPGANADWSEKTGRTMATNLIAAATALRAHPLPSDG